MREHLKKIVSFVLIAAVALSAVHYAMQETLIAKATKEDDLKKNIDELNNQISDLNDNISDMEEQQEILEEEMDDLNAEIINTLTSIGMKEDALVEKEAQIEDKQVDIDATSKDYEEAKSKEEARYRDMVVRLRKMYEKGNTNTDNLNLLLSGNGLGDMLNRMDNVESIYEYDRVKMEEYETAKNEALAEINKLATVMATEANIETLIVAKGFSECVAVISGDDASIVVKSDGLSAAQLTQINEIVYNEAGISPVNITIIER